MEMNIELNEAYIKKCATVLKEYLKLVNIELKQSNALIAISKMHGYENWNTLSAILKRETK